MANTSVVNVAEMNSQLRAVDAEINRLNTVKASLLAILAAVGAVVGAAKRPGRPKGSGGRKPASAATAPATGEKKPGRPLSEGSLRATIARVLTGKTEPMGIKQIADAVRASGYKSTSQSFEKQVATALIKPEFQRVSHGQYKLRTQPA